MRTGIMQVPQGNNDTWCWYLYLLMDSCKPFRCHPANV